MTLDELQLLSPYPVRLNRIGSIKPAKLKDIARITLPFYHFYLFLLSMTTSQYQEQRKQEQPEDYAWFQSLSEADKENITMFDYVLTDTALGEQLTGCLNFFFEEHVALDRETGVFLLFPPESSDQGQMREQTKPSGILTKEQYPEVCRLILQMHCMKAKNADYQDAKPKNEHAKRLLEKLNKHNRELEQTNGTERDKKNSLANIISSLASFSNSLHLGNIWELTVYQLYDQYKRQQQTNLYQIQSMSVAAWGSKGNSFDLTSWAQPIQ